MMRSTRTNVRTRSSSTPLDNAAICALIRQHDRPVVRFSGVHEFLSNFYPSVVTALFVDEANERTCAAPAPTVEHAYQAMKAQDIHQFRRVLRRETAKQARADGKTLAARPDWDQERVAIMRLLVQQKFADPLMAARLLATGQHELVEGNTWGDRFWGMTPAIIPEERPVLPHQSYGRYGDVWYIGENWLGKILMERRAVLAKGGR